MFGIKVLTVVAILPLAIFGVSHASSFISLNEECNQVYMEDLYYTEKSTNLPTRNNNPGNIRRTGRKYFGETSKGRKYESFYHPSWGYAAMFDLLNRKYNGLTIKEAIEKWAPESDGNDTVKYIKFVAEKTGFDPELYKINVSDQSVIKVASAMSTLEGMKGFTENDVGVGYMLWEFCYQNWHR